MLQYMLTSNALTEPYYKKEVPEYIYEKVSNTLYPADVGIFEKM